MAGELAYLLKSLADAHGSRGFLESELEIPKAIVMAALDIRSAKRRVRALCELVAF